MTRLACFVALLGALAPSVAHAHPLSKTVLTALVIDGAVWIPVADLEEMGAGDLVVIDGAVWVKDGFAWGEKQVEAETILSKEVVRAEDLGLDAEACERLLEEEPTDVIFELDPSGSIGSDGFVTALQWMEEVVSSAVTTGSSVPIVEVGWYIPLGDLEDVLGAVAVPTENGTLVLTYADAFPTEGISDDD